MTRAGQTFVNVWRINDAQLCTLMCHKLDFYCWMEYGNNYDAVDGDNTVSFIVCIS